MCCRVRMSKVSGWVVSDARGCVKKKKSVGVGARSRVIVMTSSVSCLDPARGLDYASDASRCCFSLTSISSSRSRSLRARSLERDGNRILTRHSCTQRHRSEPSASPVRPDSEEDSLEPCEPRSALKRSRPNIGANESTERKTSLTIRDGEDRRDDIDCGVGEGWDATVCSMSPICEKHEHSKSALGSDGITRSGGEKAYLASHGRPRESTDERPERAVVQRHAADAAGDVDSRPGNDANQAQDRKPDPGRASLFGADPCIRGSLERCATHLEQSWEESRDQRRQWCSEERRTDGTDGCERCQKQCAEHRSE